MKDKIKEVLVTHRDRLRDSLSINISDVKINSVIGIGIIESVVKNLNLDSVNKWVAIKDRLPEVNIPILCARTETSMSGVKRMSSSIGRVNRTGRFNCEFNHVGVDYWMEIKPPVVNNSIDLG